jgi:hypothetical protein
VTTATPVDLGEALAEGSGDALARASHIHKLLVRLAKAGATVGTRKAANFIDGSNITVSVVDNAGSDRVDITIAASGLAANDAEYLVGALHAGLTAERLVTDTTTVTWDLATPGQAKANVPNDAITNAKLRDSAARSVIGKATTGVGDPADIVAAIDTVLGRDGTADLAFGRVVTNQIEDNAVANTKLRASGALSVIGRSANSAGDPADISAVAASGAVLRESGSTLGFGTVATAGITDAAVTYAKIQDVSAASKLLGRGDSGSGDVQEITLGTNLSMSGTTLNASGGAGSGDDITVNGAAVTGADFDDATPTAPAGGVNVVWQKDGSTPANVSAAGAANAVSNTVLRDSSGFSVIGKATSGAGDPADIVAGDETVFGRTGAGNLAFAQLATGQIANSAVTYAKIQDVSAGARVLGRTSVAGAGPITELTGTNLQTIIGSPSFVKDANTTIAAASDITWLTLAANSGNITGTGLTTVMSITGVGAGRYYFYCMLIYQATATGTGMNVAVNHTGTVTGFVAEARVITTGAAATTKAASQAAQATLLGMVEGEGTRTLNAAIGTAGNFVISVDAANSDMLCFIEGSLIVSVSGTLEIKLAAEAAALVVTARQGSHLELRKLS